MPGRLSKFKELYPELEFVLRVGNTKDIAELLRKGEVDFALVEGQIFEGDLLEKPWLKDELVLVSSPKHPLANLDGLIEPEILSNQTWIIREKGSGTRSTIEENLTENGISLKKVQEIGHTEAIKRAVEVGMGISWLSKLSVERELSLGHLLVLNPGFKMQRWFKIISFPGRYQSEAVKKIIGLLTEV